jgi:hypothetical protein
MKRYLIKQTDEVGTYIRGDSYLEYITIRDTITRAASTPSTVKIQIDDPCGNAAQTEVDMTSLGSGVYSYDYTISATAPYGKYAITISTATYTQKAVYSYFVFPWDVTDEVRQISGIGQNKVISDNDLGEIIWEAYKEAKERVYEHHHDIKSNPCWSSCSGHNYCINGSNTTFFVPMDIADHDGDTIIKGWGEQSCGTDINGYYKDCDGWCQQVKITVQDASCGRLTVTDQADAAIPSTAKGLYFDLYTESSCYNDDLFRDAVMYLAAHKCILRFGELERASSADLTTAQNIKYVDPKRMWKQYRNVMSLIEVPTLGGVY